MYKLYGKLFLCMAFLSFSCICSMDYLKKHNAEKLEPIIKHAKLMAKKKDKEIPLFIAIAGCSGVGKSYFVQELAGILEQESIRVAILKFDDFLNPDHFDSNHFHPRLEHKKAHSVIQKILYGEKSVRKPVWNLKELSPPSKIEENFSVEGIDLVLFEGEFTLCDDEAYNFRRYSEFGIFIDAEDDDVLQWNWTRAREVPEKTQEEFVANNKPYLQRYREYVRSSRDSALYLLLKDANHRYMLQK